MTIDELVVKLVLDATGFSKGQADAAASLDKTRESAVKSAKGIEASALAASDGVEKLGRKFLGLYALLTGGRELKAFVSDMTAADAALGRTARNIDMSAKSLSVWQGAAEVAGGSAQGITGSLANLSGAMQEAALTGNNRLAPVMRALGINLADAKGHARDVGDVLVDLNRRAQGMDPARFTSLMHMIGIDDGTITLLEKTTTEFDKLRAEQEKYAATSADTDAAQRRQSGWRELLITSSSLGRTILTALTPAIVEAMNAVQDWADKNQDWIKTGIVDAVKSFSEWLKKIDWKEVGTGISDFVKKVDGIASALLDTIKSVDPSSDLFKAFEAFGAMLAGSVLLRITGISSALTALGGVALPGWLGSLLTNPAVLGTVAVGAVLASGDPKKALLDGGPPDVQPQDNDLGLPMPDGSDRRSDTSDAQAKAGGFLSWFKKAIGWGDKLHDDTKTKDNIEDTAKATKGILDVLKSTASNALSAFGGVTASSGGLGGSGQHVNGVGGRGGSFPGASLGDHARGGIGRNAAQMEAGARESFAFWMSKGLTREQAAGLVGMEQGESQFNPRIVGDHGEAHGAFQWHAPRRAEIKAGTGIDIDTATHKQQLEAAYWEFQHKEAGAWARIKQGRTATDAARAGVTYFERPKDKAGQSIVRGGMAEGWLKRFNEEDAKAKGGAPAGAGTPAPSGPAVTDAEVFAARQRIINGSRDPKDRALVDRYKAQQNTPKTAAPAPPAAPAPAAPASPTPAAPAPASTPHASTPAPHTSKPTVTHGKPLPSWMTPGADGPIRTTDYRDPKYAPHQPTFNDLAHHIVKAIQRARKLTHHGDKPVAVTYVDKNGVAPSSNPLADLHKWRFDYAMKHPHAAAIDRMTRMAAAGSYSHTVNNNSTDTKIHGGVHVHTQATDAKGIAADLDKYLFQGSDARQANRGLA